MNPLSKILGGTLSEIITSVGGVVDKLTTTDAEKLEAQRKLTELTLGFQEKMAELDQQWAAVQADVIKTEAQGSWMQRNWRPLSMLSFVFVILYQYCIVPTFHLPAVTLPPDLWTVIQVGFGGYVFGRTAEKVAPVVAEVMKKK